MTKFVMKVEADENDVAVAGALADAAATINELRAENERLLAENVRLRKALVTIKHVTSPAEELWEVAAQALRSEGDPR